MSREISELKVKVVLDDKQARESIDELYRKMEVTKEAMEYMNSQAKEIAEYYKAYTKGIIDVIDVINKTKESE